MYQYAQIVSIPKSKEINPKVRLNGNKEKSKRCLKLKQLINDNCHNTRSKYNDEFMELPNMTDIQHNTPQNIQLSNATPIGNNYENRKVFSPKVQKVRKQVSFRDLNISMDEV